jgi:hypothetical protein
VLASEVAGTINEIKQEPFAAGTPNGKQIHIGGVAVGASGTLTTGNTGSGYTERPVLPRRKPPGLKLGKARMTIRRPAPGPLPFRPNAL